MAAQARRRSASTLGCRGSRRPGWGVGGGLNSGSIVTGTLAGFVLEEANFCHGKDGSGFVTSCESRRTTHVFETKGKLAPDHAGQCAGLVDSEPDVAVIIAMLCGS